MKGWVHIPNSPVKVTCIARQCFILRQPNGSLWMGDHIGKWRGELSLLPSPIGLPLLGLAFPFGNPPKGLASDILSTKLLNMVAIDMKLVAVN